MSTNIESKDSEQKCFNYVGLNDSDSCISTIKQEALDPLETYLEGKKEDVQSGNKIHGRKEASLKFCKVQDHELNVNINNDNALNYTSYDSTAERRKRKRTMLRNKSLVRPYRCELCPMAFNRPQHLKSHVNTHLDEESYKCDICGKCCNRKSNLKAHKFVHSGDKPYPCESCGKSFAQKVALEYHMRIHTGERPYPCDICNKSFRAAPHLEVHRRIHTEERPYSCVECGQQFKMSAHLTAHKRTHTGEKPYVCEICNKAFGHLQSHRNHMNLHKIREAHICSICSKSFVSSRDLVSHSQDHISSELGNLYECQRCFVSFPNELDLRLHSEVHSKTRNHLYICHCGEVFASELEHENHKKVHLGETPYTCDICDQSFSRDILLIQHLEEHEDKDKKPFVCEFCGKLFSCRNELDEHICITESTTPSGIV